MKRNNLKKILCAAVFLSMCISSYSQPKTVAEKRQAVVDECKKYIGTPYVLGGESKAGIDCSGLVMITARDIAGIMIPRKASDIYSFVRIIPDDQKQPGDLLFFRTNGSGISHVAVYIGKNQFIHAISDGPNTGVIVSSLDMPYWKPKYAGCGTYFPADNSKKKSSSNSTAAVRITTKSQELQNQANARFPVDFDATGFFNWNLFTYNAFMFNPRGFSVQLHGQYNRWAIKPGLAIDFRDEIKMGVFQIPLLFTLEPKDFIRIYAGPVFTIGTPHQIESEKELKSSIFPGIIGLSFQTPALQIKETVGIRFVQDISYEVFNEPNNSALDFKNSAAAGITFQTGVRFDVYLPSVEKMKEAKALKSGKTLPKNEDKTEQQKSNTENKEETVPAADAPLEKFNAETELQPSIIQSDLIDEEPEVVFEGDFSINEEN